MILRKYKKGDRMAVKKQYADVKSYEQKLARVMNRLQVEKYEYDWTRHTAYVQFFYKNQWYRFDHSVEKVNTSKKMVLTYGTDVFAQIVLALEDLARMVERGIYDLDIWVSGMRYLPQKEQLPSCFVKMGYALDAEKPSREDLESRYRSMLKKVHPDNGGTTEEFIKLQNTMEECLDYL